MATVLLPDQLDDFVNLTLENVKTKSWTDISLSLQRYEFASRFFDGKSDPEKGGSQLNWKVQVRNTGTARNSELYDVDTTGVVDLSTEAKVPWTKQTVNFSYDVDEDVFQTDRETIIREVEMRDHSMYNDYFELQEENLWNFPASSTVSPRPPMGIPFWVVKNATEGFTGADPSGWAGGAGGIDTDTYANWKNYAFAATVVDREDFIAKVLKAIEFTQFEAPKTFAELGGGKSDWGFYTTYDVQALLEKYLQGSNDNLGVDIAKYTGSVLIRGNPVRWVPYLQTNDTQDPFYGINWKVFKYFYRKGRKMLRHPPHQRDPQHTVRVVHMDSWGNFLCYNRRRNFVGYFASGAA